MAKPTLSRVVDRVSIISADFAAASTPPLVIRDQNMPSGDVAVRSLTISYDANITAGTGTVARVTNGHIFYLNGLTVETDKHGKIVDNVDGLLFYVMNMFDFQTAGLATALTATPVDADTPACSWIVPFSLFRGHRPYDTNLDVLKAKIKVTTQYGPGTTMWSATTGTPVIQTLDQAIESKILPGPLTVAPVEESELPAYVRSFEQQLIPVTATQSRMQIQIPFGDRIFRRIFITQRNTSDKTELATVITATAEISLYMNGQPIVDRRRWADIRRENKLVYSLETLPTGVAVLDFDMDDEERVNDMLWSLTLNSGNAYLYIDVTSVTNGGILLGYDCLKPISPAALRG